jgi:HAD superfamily hydrolase (TIGR01509 family)
MKKYILFDNDGVLVETEPWYFKASKIAIKEFFNLELEFDEYMEIMAKGTTVWESALANGARMDEVVLARDKRNEYYQEFIQNENIAIVGVQEILKELSKKYKMAIVTTSRRVDFELIHKDRGIVDFMDFVLCEDEYARPKPQPDPYLKGLEMFNATKEETIIVEDSQRVLSSAYAANIDCVIVSNEFTKTQDFRQATYKIKTLKEFQILLETI